MMCGALAAVEEKIPFPKKAEWTSVITPSITPCVPKAMSKVSNREDEDDSGREDKVSSSANHSQIGGGGCRWGSLALSLIGDLERFEWLPLYDEEKVRQIKDEMGELVDEIVKTLNVTGCDLSDPFFGAAVQLHHSALFRNKRCVIAYLRYRLNKIRALRWDATSTLPDFAKKNMSALERRFYGDYDKTLAQYCMDVNIDLMADLEPPKEICIEVRVLENCGQILTESGPLNLESGTTHYLRRSDVEHLIRQGRLEQINSDK